jgi:hypothetical protein
MNVFLTAAFLNVAICSGVRLTPAGGPDIVDCRYGVEGISIPDDVACYIVK